MNKKMFLIICLVIVLLIGGVFAVLRFNKASKVEIFNIAEYSKYISEFPSDKVLGPINNAEIAKEKVESLWVEIYGESIKNKKPYIVLFDDKNQVWLVKGSLPKIKLVECHML